MRDRSLAMGGAGMQWLHVWSFIALAGVMIGGCSDGTFRPIYHVRFLIGHHAPGENYLVDTSHVFSNEERGRLMAVLVYYGWSARYDDDRNVILIPETLHADTEMVVNMLTKADDSVWMCEHILTGPRIYDDGSNSR